MALRLATGRLDALPWGSALFGFASRAVTALVSLNFGSHELRFERGVVVGARAPITDVDPVRLAIAFELLGPARESEARHRLAAQPHRDDLDVIAELAGLDVDGTLRFHRKVLARRAAATFAVEDGSYDVFEKASESDAQGIEVQPIIYLGALLHAKQARLVRELERFGDRFKLRREGLTQLERFGFTDGEQPIIAALAEPRAIPELVAAGRPLGPHEVLSAIYALAACDLCEASMVDAKQRSRVNSKVSFRKKAVGVAPPIGATPASHVAPAPIASALATPTPSLPPEPEPTQRVSGTFDLSAALSAELGDEVLAFEVAPAAPVVAARPFSPAEPEPEPEPEPEEDDVDDERATNVMDIPQVEPEPEPEPELQPQPVVQAVAADDSRANRKAKRTQQLLAFVAVPRAPARKP